MKESIPNRGVVEEGSTRKVTASEEYCRTLAKDFDIVERVVIECFKGEPMKRAYKLCKWAEENVEGDCNSRGTALDSFAKKQRIGKYRPEFVKPKAKTTREQLPPEQVMKNVERLESMGTL